MHSCEQGTDDELQKKVMRVEGILHPTNHAAIMADTRSDMAKAVSLSGLLLWANDAGLWAHGIVSINTYMQTSGGQKVALEFLTSIRSLIQEEGIEPLGLTGALVVTVESDAEPINFRATVKNGEIRYQQGTLVWEKEEVLS